METDSKRWWTSRMLWLNTVHLLSAAGTAALEVAQGAELPPGVVAGIGSAVAVGNIVLRFLTTKPIR